MHKYWAYYLLGLQNTLAYRGPMLFWLAGNTLSIVCMIAVWLAVKSGQNIAGYSKNELIAYYLVGLVVQWFVGWYPFSWIKNDIKDGSIVGQILLKPVDFFWRCFTAEIAWHSISVFAGLASAIFVSFFFRDYLSAIVVGNFDLFFIITVWLSALLCFTFSLCLGLLAFWFVETSIFDNLFWGALSLLGGHALPISFIPKYFQTVLGLLPFRYMFSFPLEYFFRKLNSGEVFYGIIIQLFWIIIFTFLYRLMWKRGTKIYSAWGQ